MKNTGLFLLSHNLGLKRLYIPLFDEDGEFYQAMDRQQLRFKNKQYH